MDGILNAIMAPSAGSPASMITDLSKYSNLNASNPNLTADFKPLNFDALLKAGAFRATHQGLPDGSYNPDPKAGFSLVSAYNDVSGNQSRKWIDNPDAYPIVKELFTTRPQDIGAYKYLQILQSARDLGLTDKDIFMSK